MERRRFLLTSLAGAPFLTSAALPNGRAATGKAFKVSVGAGRLHGHITLKGVNSNTLDLKVSGKDTDGGMAIFEQTSVSPGRGTPLHVHPLQDEVFYVLEGAYLCQVGGQRFHLAPGDSMFMPRNVPHSWIQLSERGKMTVIFQPAGKMEEFFVYIAALDHTPEAEELARAFTAHEMRIVGPPVKPD